MDIRRIFIFIFLSFGASFQALGQNMTVSSFYPASAFVINRLLSFQVNGDQGQSVKSVRLTSGDSCQAMVDPYHATIFHIFCRKPSLVSAEILVENPFAGQQNLAIDFINVFRENDPEAGWSHTFKTGEEP